MKRIKLCFKLLIRQWSWHNDKDMFFAFCIMSLICGIIGFVGYQIPLYISYPIMLIFFITVYNIVKFCLFFILCCFIVAFIEDRRLQMQYGIMYNWRQPPKKHCNLEFNTTGDDYVKISRSVGNNQ